jgi:hypothetical protein
MNFREKERERVLKYRDEIFKDPGGGKFEGKEWDFVLKDPVLNLWKGIRTDAQDYFKRNKIPWWQGEKDNPTGHLLSSQIACVNHLYYLRQRKDLATAVLKGINKKIIEAEIVDDGYVEFEFIGCKNYLGEKSWQKGANSTSIDAVMIGRHENGKKVYFLIEWKYTEFYNTEDKYIPATAKVYDHLIKDVNSPFNNIDVKAFYFEPFYQLMRQTLLGWKLVENNDHSCSEYYHVHIIPDENRELLDKITSPELKKMLVGNKENGMIKAWMSTLKNPDKYIHRSPEEFLKPCKDIIDSKSFISYLEKRYWWRFLHLKILN